MSESDKELKPETLLVTAGRRYVKHVQQMGRTHMIAVAWEKDA